MLLDPSIFTLTYVQTIYSMTTPGIDLSHSAEAAAKVFLHTVGILASAQKFTVFSLAECLGLSFVTPLMRPSSGNKAIVDSDVALQHARFLYEPKFRYVFKTLIQRLYFSV